MPGHPFGTVRRKAVQITLVVQQTPRPALLDARRRLAGELLAAAAVHSAISDELEALERLRDTRPLDPAEEERCAVLRMRKRAALRQHDAAQHRLRRLAAHLRSYSTT